MTATRSCPCQERDFPPAHGCLACEGTLRVSAHQSDTAVEASYGPDGRLYICFEDATGLIQGEGGVQAGDGPYPSMVSWEMGAGTMLADDARALGLALIRLAEDCDRAMAEQSRPWFDITPEIRYPARRSRGE